MCAVRSIDRTLRARLAPRVVPAGMLLIAVLLWPPAAAAQADHVFTVHGGYFALRGEDGRGETDVLFRNLDFLAFDLEDFNGGTFGAEWAVGVGRFLEVGAGAGFYRRTVPSVYRNVVADDGFEIEQDLRLRIAPVTFLARVFPAGRRGGVQPYIGGGVAILAWRYSETGEWVAPDDSLFRATYEDSGNKAGPVLLGGVRFGSDVMFAGGEFRYQAAKADLDPDVEFASRRLDLGGYQWLFTFGVRF
jgi:hypothetical protein